MSGVVSKLEDIKRQVRELLDRCEQDMSRKRRAGICVMHGCDAPASDTADPVFGDCCAIHGRELELELLIEDQDDDAKGLLP